MDEKTIRWLLAFLQTSNSVAILSSCCCPFGRAILYVSDDAWEKSSGTGWSVWDLNTACTSKHSASVFDHVFLFLNLYLHLNLHDFIWTDQFMRCGPNKTLVTTTGNPPLVFVTPPHCYRLLLSLVTNAIPITQHSTFHPLPYTYLQDDRWPPTRSGKTHLHVSR